MVHFEIHQEGRTSMRELLFDQHIKKLKETDSLKPVQPLAALFRSDLFSVGPELQTDSAHWNAIYPHPGYLRSVSLPFFMFSLRELSIFGTEKYCQGPEASCGAACGRPVSCFRSSLSMRTFSSSLFHICCIEIGLKAFFKKNFK